MVFPPAFVSIMAVDFGQAGDADILHAAKTSRTHGVFRSFRRFGQSNNF